MLGKAIVAKCVAAAAFTACAGTAAICLNGPVAALPSSAHLAVWQDHHGDGGRGDGGRHHRHSPPPTTSTTIAMDTQNIAVTVPAVPPQRALPGLCRAFLASNSHGKSGAEFKVLVGATGGTISSTTAWCKQYLNPPRPHL